MTTHHVDTATLTTALAQLRQAPRPRGRVELIVRRPHDGPWPETSST